jgi:hypothetical protein
VPAIGLSAKAPLVAPNASATPEAIISFRNFVFIAHLHLQKG